MNAYFLKRSKSARRICFAWLPSTYTPSKRNLVPFHEMPSPVTDGERKSMTGTDAN